MSTQSNYEVERRVQQSGRTLIDLKQLEDGSWIATQLDVEIEGTGETGALALMDYCRKIATDGCSVEQIPDSAE